MSEKHRAQVESDKLRQEAKDRLGALLFLMGHRFEPDAVDRIVDCIIGAATLESAALQAKAIRAASTTEPPEVG